MATLTLASVLSVSCGSDDDQRSVRAEDAGAGGEAGSDSDPNAGGSSMSAAGQGGAETTAGGAGGVPAAPAAGAGGAPVAGAGGSSAAGESGSAGAAGAPGELTSLFCSEPGEYYSGEGGCLACEGEPEPQTVTCHQAFYAKDVEASGGPTLIVLAPNDAPREALPITVTVTYQLADSVEQLEADMTFDFNDSYWEIDVADVPQSATQMRVQPFTVQALCGDAFTLTDEVIFVTSGGDSWAPTCPGQT